MNASIFISFASFIISSFSLIFAIYAWKHANRPLVTARVTTVSGGNMGVAINLLLENTGNRPAKNIYFKVKEEDVRNASLKQNIPEDALQCFYSNISIPVLANNRSTSNAFWHFGQEDSWRANSILPITLCYQDIDGRKYQETMNLYLADDSGFAQTFWQAD